MEYDAWGGLGEFAAAMAVVMRDVVDTKGKVDE